MKKLLQYITIATIALLPLRNGASPIDDLEKAKKQLEDGKKQLLDGKESLAGNPAVDADGKIIKPGAYADLKAKIDQMTSGAAEAQPQIEDMKKYRLMVIGALAGLPLLIPLITLIPIVNIALGSIAWVAIPTAEVNLANVPATLEAVKNSIEAIVNTLNNVAGIITPANERMNPKLIPKPPVYVKFDAALQKFDDAINKIDTIVKKLKALESALGGE